MEEKLNFILKKEIKGLAEWEKHFLLECFERGRQSSNYIKRMMLPKFEEMTSLPEYIDAKNKYKEIKKEYDKVSEKKDKESKDIAKELKLKMKEQTDILNKIQYKYKFYKMFGNLLKV